MKIYSFFRKFKREELNTSANQNSSGADIHAGSPHLFVPPGHFYSPIVGPDDLAHVSGYPPRFGDLSLNRTEQEALLEKISKLGIKFPMEPEQGKRYYSNNDQYGDGDAFIYSSILEYLNPSKIIEIGSGYSTAVVLDWRDTKNNDRKITIEIIEPFPARVNSLCKPSDQFELHQCKIQEIELEIFGQLNENDILFIDSSHVGKSGSDVLFELFEILPRLKKGVWIHFHDVFWPFEYPESWLELDNRSWNEVHFLRAFLAYNNKFRIRFFNQFLFHNSPKWEVELGKIVSNPGGGLWLEVL